MSSHQEVLKLIWKTKNEIEDLEREMCSLKKSIEQKKERQNSKKKDLNYYNSVINLNKTIATINLRFI